MRLGDVEAVPSRGLRLLVRRSKTDQHGSGQEVAIWGGIRPSHCCARQRRSTLGCTCAQRRRPTAGILSH